MVKNEVFTFLSYQTITHKARVFIHIVIARSETTKQAGNELIYGWFHVDPQL